ncbi:MAG: hypothetical protein GF332_02190 [Candidatus Moranbacteria bacterium]|nr:hypothetical protein [Candidatus Moranbacteria bacterium]
MKRKIFFWSLLLIGFLSAAVGWIFINSFFQTANLNWTGITIAFTLHLFCLFTLVIVSDKHAEILAVFGLLPALIVTLSWLVFFSLILSSTIYFIGINRVKKIQKNSIKIKMIHAIIFGYALISTPVCLLPSTAYYVELNHNQEIAGLPNFKVKIPQIITDSMMNMFNNLIQNDFYFSNPELTTQELIKQKIRQEAEAQNQEFDPNTHHSQEILNQQHQNLEKSLDMELKPEQTMSQVFNRLINQEIEHYFNSLRNNQSVPGWGLAIALFITLKTITWAIRMPLSLAITFFYKILKKYGLITVERKLRPIERLRVAK